MLFFEEDWKGNRYQIMTREPFKKEQTYHGERMSRKGFERMIEENPNVRYEYVKGRAYAMESASVNHNRLVGKLYSIIVNCLTRPHCHAFISQMYVQIDEQDLVLPDVVVMCEQRDFTNDKWVIRSPLQ